MALIALNLLLAVEQSQTQEELNALECELMFLDYDAILNSTEVKYIANTIIKRRLELEG